MSEEEYELAIAGLLAMIDAKNARIAELERKYSAACDRNQELEGELARLFQSRDWVDVGSDRLIHHLVAESAQCSACN